MHYLKKNTKFSILAFLVLILFITISISTLAKTEVYFSLLDNPQKEIIKNINQAQAFINIAMYVFTGSYNWTFSANNRNDENLLIIDDPETIEIFQNHFEKLWFDKFSLKRTRQLYQIAKVDFPFFLTTSPKPEVQTININTASQDEFIKILKISEPLAQKIINLRESQCGVFKETKDLLQLPELTNLDWREWEEEGIIIIIN